MFQVPGKRAVGCAPGGLMVVFLLSAPTMVTLFPDTSGFFGSFGGAPSGVGILLGGMLGEETTGAGVPAPCVEARTT